MNNKKQIMFGSESRDKLVAGMNILSKAVSVTLGPKGRNVIIQKEDGLPHISKDGVTVAKSIHLEDETENMGASLLREASNRTAIVAGDGSTTVVVLAHAMVSNGIKFLNSGSDPMDLKRGMEKASSVLIDSLKLISKPISDQKEIEQVASISANSDLKIGSLISEAMNLVGPEGLITVEDSGKLEDELETVEGMNIERGYMSPYFINKYDKHAAIFENPLILLANKQVYSFKEIVKPLELAIKNNRPIIIIAEEFDTEVISNMITNVNNNVVKGVLIKAPGFGENRLDSLKDIASVTGTKKIVSDDLEIYFEDIKLEDFGSAARVEVFKDNTKIIGGNHIPENLIQHIKYLEDSYTYQTNEYLKEKIKKRISKLNGGVAIIKVGGATEVEINEKKDRIDDALHSTKAAIEEGIVPGGGVALIRAFQTKLDFDVENQDQKYGTDIVFNSILSPLTTICKNAGYPEHRALDYVFQSEGSMGYDAKLNRFGDLYEFGIIDPTKVTRVALESAISIASLILTTEASISNLPEKPNSLINLPSTINL